MIYSRLQLKQTERGFEYTDDRLDRLDREEVEINCTGLPGVAWVYCPRGQEKIWKKRLVQYVEDRLKADIISLQETLRLLQKV